MTLKEIQALSDHALRIKVAELAGFTDVAEYDPCEWLIAHDCGCACPDMVGTRNGVRKRDVPDYPCDLNAVRELELSLVGNQARQVRYLELLDDVVAGKVGEKFTMNLNFAEVAATARQRCEAYVLAMDMEHKDTAS